MAHSEILVILHHSEHKKTMHSAWLNSAVKGIEKKVGKFAT